MKKYPIDLKAVGSRLRAAREEVRMTMDQMREISGYSKSLISSAENGLKKPSVLYLFALYERFNVSIHYILNGTGPMFLEPEPKPAADSTGKAMEKPSGEFLRSDDKLNQMLHMMEHVDMVRFAVLSHFINYRTQNKQVIDELLKEKEEQKREQSDETLETVSDSPGSSQ